MLSITVDVCEAKRWLGTVQQESAAHVQVLHAWARQVVRQGLEAVLRAELTVLLEREREPAPPAAPVNWRNGYRTRTLSLAGLGPLPLRIPRDRQGRYRSALLPFRKRRTQGLEAMAAELFLAGLSTRDVSRVLERHFGDRFDSKEISRMVAATSGELDAWRTRSLADTPYRFLYLDGAHFTVRRAGAVEKLPVLAVIGVRADTDKMEVLALEVGDRERKDLWAAVFQDLVRRGLDAAGVELGVMDGLPGLEAAFQAAFPNGQTQRCQVHAKRNAVKRVGQQDRPAFKADLDRVFYAANEAAARRAFVAFRTRWAGPYPTAVGIIERDLDSLVRFYQWEACYWPSLRTTNPIERLHKEFKRRTNAMEVIGGERTMYRLLAYVACTMNFNWRTYALSTPKHFYTLKAA